MINSYETGNFEVGKEYHTYYVDLSNNGTKLRDYTGIMKVKLISKDPSQYSPKGYKHFKILESKPLGSTIAHNIHNYFEGYGSASCYFFESKDDCIKHHDEKLIELSKGQNTKDRDNILKKLINSKTPDKPKIELDSIAWYESLTKKEQSYVSWIKHYYEKI
jgi:hypothetical protein